MKTKIKRLLILFAALSWGLSSAQTNDVNGIVKSSVDEMSLPGVTVLVKGTTQGTTTDFDGNFTISVSSDDTLVFSYIGYITQEILVGNQTSFTITMEESAAQLEEIVIVGYGTQKKVTLTGAQITVDTKKLEDRPFTRASQMLSGQAAGVSVLQQSGKPGGDNATIRIRGVGTFGNNNPLVLVDGVISSLDAVNPADIESMTVLKDAASASIYGSRAANGVILVTTKTGKIGKISVDIDGYYGVQNATKLTDYVTNSVEFMELKNLAINNEDPTATPMYTQEQIEEFRTGTDPYIYPNTDWNDEMYDAASIQSYNLRFHGGNEKTRYSFSMGYLDQEGVLRGTSAEQYNIRLNLNSQVSKGFSYSVNITGRHDDIHDPVVGDWTLTGWTNRALPMYGTYLEDGRYNDTWLGNSSQNSLAGADEGKNDTMEDLYIINASGTYEFIEGLSLTGMAAVQKEFVLQKIFRPEIFVYNPKTLQPKAQGSGGAPLSAVNYQNQRTRITLNLRADYEKTFGENHNTSFLFGFNQDTDRYDYMSASKAGIPSNALHEIDAGSIDPTAGGGRVNFGLQSFFGRARYDYKEKYLFEANFRYDGSSNFAEGNKWGFFPSLSVGWNIASENFMENSAVINTLKLRASWGQLGNQDIAPNQYSALYTLGQNYSFGGSLVGGAAQTKLPNEDITWETSTQTDIGVDFMAWNGKLGFMVDYYNKLTEDILRSTSISAVIGGLSPPLVNLASIKNTGWEFTVSHDNTIGEISYGIGLNFTTINNEVVKIAAPIIGGWTRIQEGRPINEFYAIKMIGIFQDEAEVIAHGAQPDAQPGDVKFEDFDGNGVIDGDDRQAAGSSIPTSSFGLNLSLAYKGFDFVMLMQGFGGIHAITEEEQKPFFNGAGVPKFWVENAWTEENPNNSYPRLTRSSNYINNAWRRSTFLLEDSSFLRIKNIQIGYNLPEHILSKIKFDRFRIFFNTQNPFTFTNYRGLDPEKNVYVGRGSYTNVSVYSFGLNLSL